MGTILPNEVMIGNSLECAHYADGHHFRRKPALILDILRFADSHQCFADITDKLVEYLLSVFLYANSLSNGFPVVNRRRSCRTFTILN